MTKVVAETWRMHLAGKSTLEIMDETGLTRQAVANRLARARDELGITGVDVQREKEEREVARMNRKDDLERCPMCLLLKPCDPCLPERRREIMLKNPQ